MLCIQCCSPADAFQPSAVRSVIRPLQAHRTAVQVRLAYLPEASRPLPRGIITFLLPWQRAAAVHPATRRLSQPFASAQGLDKTSHAGTQLLLIKGLPSSIDEEYLIAMFKAFGTVIWARMAAVREEEATRSGYIFFANQDGAAAAIREMDGAEVCGVDGNSFRGTCAQISVDLGNSANQRLLSRLQAVKRELLLHQRIDVESQSSYLHSTSTTRGYQKRIVDETISMSALSDLSGDRAVTNMSVSGNLASQGKAIGPDVADVNEQFNLFLHRLRSLLPQSAPTAHASISNVAALGLALSRTPSSFYSGSKKDSDTLQMSHPLSFQRHHRARGQGYTSASRKGAGKRGRGPNHQDDGTSLHKTTTRVPGDGVKSHDDTRRGRGVRGGRWRGRRGASGRGGVSGARERAE